MALYHFHVEQIKRSEGRTAVASAAYRAGEKLHNLWDGETHDYTKKGGVILSEIMLPEYAPERFSDRYTLWNEVEQIEKHFLWIHGRKNFPNCRHSEKLNIRNISCCKRI